MVTQKNCYWSGCFPVALFLAPGFAFALESGFGLAAAFRARLAADFSLKIALTSLRTSCAAFTASCTSETSEKISGILTFFSSSVALTKVAAPQVHAICTTSSKRANRSSNKVRPAIYTERIELLKLTETSPTSLLNI